MQVFSSRRAASPRCFSATASRSTCWAELFASQSPVNLATAKPFRSFAAYASGGGLSLKVEEVSRKYPTLVNSGLQRHNSKVNAWKLNVYAVEEQGKQGEEKDDREEVKLKIPVGPIGNCLDETFTFKRVLGPSSILVTVTLRKPLGIVFEAVKKRNKERVIVAELVPGSNAQRASRVNEMFQGTYNNRKNRAGSVILNSDARPGDILRATTTVGVVVDLFGIRSPQRVVMLHRADGRSWDDTMAAFKASLVADGPLTLVLEREI